MAVRDLTLQAADRHRPYLRIGSDWVFTSADDGARLTLDGLWVGAQSMERRVILRGDYERVTLRSVPDRNLRVEDQRS